MRIAGLGLVVALALGAPVGPRPAGAEPTTPTTAPARSPADDARALVDLAELRAVKQNWEGAEEAARRAIELDRALPAAWHALACALEGQGQAADAIAAWEEALARDPQYAEALEGLGRLYAEQGKRKKAEALLERLRPLDDARAATLHHAIDLAGRPAAR
jgi:tetratricopeptide (TPR) repeat protein